jgi:hypothetical protein
MGLQLPGALTEPLGWIGMIWPEADEDKLFEAGQRWIAFAAQLRQVAQPADRAATGVWENNRGEAVDAFQAWWTGADGPKAHVEDDALAAEIIGAALIAFAVLTLALKIAFIAQLVILLIEVTQAIATAIASFGATTAEIPGFIAATRATCKRLLKQVVEHVQTFLKDLFERAKGLLRKFSGKEGEAAGDLEKLGIPAPLRGKRYQGKPLLDRYRYETQAGHPDNPFGTPVRRLSDSQREAYRVYFDDEGVLRKASDGTPFDSSAAQTWDGQSKAIFVMDEDGNMYASTYQRAGEFHHSTLSNGQPVAGAGELVATNGRVQYITARSGHYQPGMPEMQNVANELARNNVSGVPIFDFSGVNRLF